MEATGAELPARTRTGAHRATAADAAEDKAFGADRRGDEMPDWVADKQARLAKIHQAKAELKAEAKAKAAAEQPAHPMRHLRFFTNLALASGEPGWSKPIAGIDRAGAIAEWPNSSRPALILPPLMLRRIDVFGIPTALAVALRSSN